MRPSPGSPVFRNPIRENRGKRNGRKKSLIKMIPFSRTEGHESPV